jgi:uncharacterized protein YbbC (DUF1343 family)
MSAVRTGLDVLLSGDLKRLRGKRVGILCHQASVDSRLRHIVSLLKARQVTITALFAPEHGFWGTAQDQIPIAAQKNGAMNIPVFSLYGDHRAPTPTQLAHLDVLICDLQDVGSRYYTFIWTMALAMQGCAREGKMFMVVDRPNPINGVDLEGPLLDLRFASFVGLYALPVRHGMTIGEIALWMNDTYNLGVALEVVRMRDWQRAMAFEDTALPWVPPSPNMPTVDTAWVYPGGCLIEGTNLSEGRGTTRPFELIGAPYINPESLARLLNEQRLPGATFRACRFEPTFHKFKGEVCGGVQIHVRDRRTFKPFFSFVSLLRRIFDLYPRSFAWRQPPYEYEEKLLAIDILCGNGAVRGAIERGHSLVALEKSWQPGLAAFARERKPFLLYN